MKRGFTLIELLSVILILGIISLIAIPVVNSTINESKKNAFETTSNNIVNVIENKCVIIVSHSANIKKVDKIYMLEKGKLVDTKV